MKKLGKITSFFTLLLSILFFTQCNENEDQIKNNKSFNIKLNLNLSKGVFDLSKGINSLSDELLSYIDSNKNKKQINFNFRKIENKIYVNYANKELKNIINKKRLRSNFYFSEPCKTEKKTCRSKSCVEKTIKKILGDGSRSVTIKYIRNTFSVTIEWNYQDC
ncbi:MAG: hypothetical protein ACK5H1_03630 [Tenacibaculum sp.]